MCPHFLACYFECALHTAVGGTSRLHSRAGDMYSTRHDDRVAACLFTAPAFFNPFFFCAILPPHKKKMPRHATPQAPPGRNGSGHGEVCDGHRRGARGGEGEGAERGREGAPPIAPRCCSGGCDAGGERGPGRLAALLIHPRTHLVPQVVSRHTRPLAPLVTNTPCWYLYQSLPCCHCRPSRCRRCGGSLRLHARTYLQDSPKALLSELPNTRLLISCAAAECPSVFLDP